MRAMTNRKSSFDFLRAATNSASKFSISNSTTIINYVENATTQAIMPAASSMKFVKACLVWVCPAVSLTRRSDEAQQSASPNSINSIDDSVSVDGPPNVYEYIQQLQSQVTSLQSRVEQLTDANQKLAADNVKVAEQLQRALATNAQLLATNANCLAMHSLLQHNFYDMFSRWLAASPALPNPATLVRSFVTCYFSIL